MSTRFIRTRYNLVASLATDYSRPFIDEEWEKTFSLEETPFIPIEAATTGTTVTLSDLLSCSLIAIYNEDATNYIEVEWYYLRGSQVASTLNFANAGTDDTVTDDAAGGTFVTNGARVGGYVRFASAENTTNVGPFLIQTADGDVLTLTAADNVTVNADDTAATPQFLNRNLQRVVAGELLVFGPVLPTTNLLITANTAAVACRVFYAGT